MIKFSILVPAYNAEPYLKDNINSIINQTYPNWELIIVNDGSTDRTLDIIKKAVEDNPDKDIKFLTIPNGGLANARNKAIEIASGDFFCNLDADDFLGKETLEVVAEAISKEKCDIYYNDIYNYDEITQKVTNYSENYLNPTNSIKGIDAAILKLQRKLWICQGVAFYSREFIKKKKINNHIGINQGEDMFFITSALASAEKVKYVPKARGYIRYRSDSMMHASFNESFLQCLQAIDLLKDFIIKLELPQDKKDILLTLICRERILQELRIAKSICDAWRNKKSLKETMSILRKYSGIQSVMSNSVKATMSKSHISQYYIRKYAPLLFIFTTKIHRLIK